MADGKQILETDGKWFINASGEWDICEGCCAAIEHCQCVLGNLSDPRCKITMSWSNTSLTTRTFLGCTWANGETKEICPDTYISETNQSIPFGTRSREKWAFDDAGTGGFSPTNTQSGTATPVAGFIAMYAKTSDIQYTNSYGVGDWTRNSASISVSLGLSNVSYGGKGSQHPGRWTFNKRVGQWSPSFTPGTTTQSTSAVGTRITADTVDFTAFKSSFAAMGKPSILAEQFGSCTWKHFYNGETITLKWERLARADANPNILTTTTVTPNYWKASAP